MGIQDSIVQLRRLMREVITSDYILLDVPYYANVGDVMIWQGTLELLADIPYRCLYMSSIENYSAPSVGSDVTILFLGGGNWGDLWVRHQEFRHRVINDFPNNNIVQLPQSVFFKDSTYLKRDISIWALHKGKVTICLRDAKSKAFIDEHYSNVSTRLEPDMALAFDVQRYVERHGISFRHKADNLLVNRDDSEKCISDNSFIPSDAIVSDWPTMQSAPFQMYIFWGVRKVINQLGLGLLLNNKFADFCWRHWLKDVMLCNGIRFIGGYRTIYSTRLHASVLGLLLQKQVVMIDNNYGKCRGVYDLWLSGEQNIKMK